MNFIWCVFYFRKTIQLHWTRFKKGPLLPEADISGKKKKKKKSTVRFCFSIAVGLDADKFMPFTDYKKRNALEYKVNFGQNIS